MNMLNDSTKAKGSVRKQLLDERGICIYDHTDKNLVVSVGNAFLTTWLSASTQSTPFMSWLGLGTGTATPTAGDTNLQTPLATRVQGTLSAPSLTATDTTASVSFTVTSITDATHLVVSSTSGMSNGDTIVQGTNTTTITTVTDGTHLVVGSTSGWVTNVWQNVATFAPGVNTGSITEAGLFSASTAGTMYARQVFSAIPKGAGNTLIVTWSVIFA